WVVTAAHCTEGVTAECITVRAGSSYPDRDGDEVAVRQIVRHESFRDGGLDYDYALLELNAELTLDRTKQIVALPAQDEGVVEGRYYKVSGWGATKNSNDTGNGLRAVYVPIVSQEECRKVYSESGITDRMLCPAYKEGGRDSYQGDTGGPLS
nr:trypsin-like protease {500 bp clone 2} [Simulium damnosum=blackflies, infected with Onchocerca ochengi, Peptide Partial, 152 aa] [Simulium damnosum]